MKKNTLIACLIALTGFGYNSNAQIAYDGYGDFKIFLGYTNIGAKSGIDSQFDYALGEVISLGAKFTVLLKPDKRGLAEGNNSGFDESFDRTSKIFEAIDTGFFVRAHFGPAFKIADTMDPYVGIDVTLKSVGAHAGFKYKISDLIGVYTMYNYSFSSSIVGDHKLANQNYRDFDDQINYFGKTNAFTIGITFNIDY